MREKKTALLRICTAVRVHYVNTHTAQHKYARMLESCGVSLSILQWAAQRSTVNNNTFKQMHVIECLCLNYWVCEWASSANLQCLDFQKHTDQMTNTHINNTASIDANPIDSLTYNDVSLLYDYVVCVLILFYVSLLFWFFFCSSLYSFKPENVIFFQRDRCIDRSNEKRLVRKTLPKEYLASKRNFSWIECIFLFR